MAEKLTDKFIEKLPSPLSGNKITYDGGHPKAVSGFGVRVTAKGTRSFILNYRTRSGQERRFTIGSVRNSRDSDGWSTQAARDEADRLKRDIDLGKDPLAQLEADRSQKTVGELCKKFMLESRQTNAKGTADGYQGQIDNWILPILKSGTLVVDVEPENIQELHSKVSKDGGPFVANRVVSLVSHMFNRAIFWNGSKRDKGWALINPTKGVERNTEHNRERYVDPKDELARLLKALDEHEDKQAADIIRLTLLTGCRKSEALNARWDQFKFTETKAGPEGTWTKLSHHTKQKRLHHTPLSTPAVLLLMDLRAAAEAAAKAKGAEVSPWVFPGRVREQAREGVKRPWEEIRTAAKIDDVRMHDLRHSFASILVSGGNSLEIIGKLLGHTNPLTTKRYAHLFVDPLREAANRVGAVVDAGKSTSADAGEQGETGK
ncbi:integrase [Bradyrhizobium elkanii]|uniref:tyrosine-type recombinase/integrase n=1 Tax=Bradyrhizobium elkanii TaxID=29448 RepID=UPI0004B36DFA|nr:site-specific integrase [Bradyrhizobium elkanii]MCW2110262.1 integrase [Bradyrhizobium elkanii]MCW2201364.1 integrase [Bradyrhizobium elkanii]MCW2226985.1 integrase [Bradyrhizobium elkanii]WLB76431.1 site-specific integrase [Bradyrhizobium elkanii]